MDAFPPSPSVPWDELVAAALVGTARAGVPGGEGEGHGRGADRAEPSAAEPGPDDGTDDGTEDGPGHPALILLDRAALAVVRDRAGARPTTAAPVPTAPAETSPWASPAAGAALDALLERDDPELITEWLELARARGLLAPPPTLPGLLDAGNRHRALRTAIVPVTGERGRWLASLSPAWSFLPDSWPPEERVPSADHWAAQDSAGKRRILAALEERLSPGDEDFLTTALRDPAPGVRALASALLARLPCSKRGDALARRVRAHVRLGTGGRPTARLPDPSDRALGAALGLRTLSAAGPAASPEIRREWLWTLVAHAPLRTWIGHLADDRAGVVRAASSARDWDLLDALANAAVVQRDREWAAALLGPVMDRLLQGHSVYGSRGPALLALLPPEQRCAWAADAVGDTGAPGTQFPLRVLEHVPGPWTDELADSAARAVDAAPTGPDESYLPELCRVAARRLPPAFGARVRRPRPGDRPRAAAALSDLQDVLRLRRRIHEELQ
ncbi:DUF5691 domain-containing protein [Nocardiopsis suaedae]|uniref:DUF5691 domain-containing protein n=1 Tax=Nocardiopsis suaedae TaxID=3018444 RepID=A0ABT4TK32_9ACTN|nr:DUF5691 domain-containing protein [Nocardiopsis suaedae]MDA2805027.1 DUF5691 domain-containing protein [Nocardiopsis suaedae]